MPAYIHQQPRKSLLPSPPTDAVCWAQLENTLRAIEYPNIVRGPTQAPTANREASMTNTHATFEPTNSPIRPPCSTYALATAHASKWPSLGGQVPPDFCQATKLCARLGIHRALQQLGAPVNFKTLAARTRPHGGLRRARLAHDTGQRARTKTAPHRAGSTCRHWSL